MHGMGTIAPVQQPVTQPAPAAPTPPSAAPASAAPAAAVPTADEPMPPLVDFPGIEQGDMFDLIKGSKIGFFGVKGSGSIDRLDNEGAAFTVKGRMGFVRANAVIDVTRLDADHVFMSVKGKGVPDTSGRGRVVESRTNFAEFEPLDFPVGNTTIAHDGNGLITIDAEAPGLGAVHLLLQKREAAAIADAVAGAAAVTA